MFQMQVPRIRTQPFVLYVGRFDNNSIVATVISKNKIRTKQVPPILLCTTDIPPDLLVRGEGCLIQARVCRPKKRLKNEENASSVSSVSHQRNNRFQSCEVCIISTLQDLPFLEYSLHGRLLNKLKLKGMNAVFGLDIQITVGDTMIVGVAVSIINFSDFH